MAKFAGTVFKIINIFVVLLYLSVCLIPVLPAGKFWMIASLGLVFPLLFLIVVCFLTGWLFAGSRWWVFCLVALLLSWQQLSVVAGLNITNEFALSKTDSTLRVLTWNTSNWGEDVRSHTDKKAPLQPMLELVKKQQADVLCFQEFWDKRDRNSPYSNIHEFKEMGYPYSYYVRTENRSIRSGVVILSRYPMTDSAKFAYGEDDYAEHLIYTDIEFNRKKIRIFTTHLQSVRFEDREYSALSKIRHTDKSGLKDSKTIVHKLKYAYRFRGSQADFVNQKIKESPYPVIICGDFNDVPNSYTYFTIKGDLRDTFLKKGTGFGRTFQYLSPTLRIDYILADKNFEVEQFNRIRVPYSDHYPVVTDLRY